MELCEPEIFLIKSGTHITWAIIMIICYGLVLAFYIFSVIRAYRKVNFKDEFVLIPIIYCLGVTLFFRIWYFLGGIQPFCYKYYWYYYFNDFASLSKDICLCCLLVRVWEYLGSLESVENSYEANKKYTYVFMIAHFLIGYLFSVIEDYQDIDYLLFHYLGGVQIILFFVFSYAFYKLFTTIRENPDASIEKEVLVLNATSILVIVTLLARIIFNLGIQDSEIDQDVLDIVVFVFTFVSELLPCALISYILFLQQQNLTDSALRDSSFARHMP